MNLYRYSAISDYTMTNLKHNQLYMQSPKMFNDPYEFIFRFGVNDDIYLDFLKRIYGDRHNDFLKKNMSKVEVLKYTRDYYFSESWKLLGVTCLTENEMNDIMWAHYGGNHKGICIEFDKTMHPFSLCKKVEYINDVMTIYFDDLSITDDMIMNKFEEVFLRKHKVWAYENEWRLLSSANSFVEYPPSSVKSITFGFFCVDEFKKQIFESTAHLQIDYYEIVRSKDKYLIEKRLIKRMEFL